MKGKETDYYRARGFGVYYIANAVYNIVASPSQYIRGIEEILGDAKAEFLMKPFKKYTNLHEFIRCIAFDLIMDDMERGDGDLHFLREFLRTYEVEVPAETLDDEDTFADFISECDRFHDAIDEITDEVFHILFNDVEFLQKFNDLCADYIEGSGFGQEFTTRSGTLKRAPIPKWVRRAIFYRDKGECRSCKRSLTAIITRLDTERYDHIVPLARYGANDLTNLQLLCEPCNTKKAAKPLPVSQLYQRAIRP